MLSTRSIRSAPFMVALAAVVCAVGCARERAGPGATPEAPPAAQAPPAPEAIASTPAPEPSEEAQAAPATEGAGNRDEWPDTDPWGDELVLTVRDRPAIQVDAQVRDWAERVADGGDVLIARRCGEHLLVYYLLYDDPRLGELVVVRTDTDPPYERRIELGLVPAIGDVLGLDLNSDGVQEIVLMGGGANTRFLTLLAPEGSDWPVDLEGLSEVMWASETTYLSTEFRFADFDDDGRYECVEVAPARWRGKPVVPDAGDVPPGADQVYLVFELRDHVYRLTRASYTDPMAEE